MAKKPMVDRHYCVHCGSGFSTEGSLRGHKNRSMMCKRKEAELRRLEHEQPIMPPPERVQEDERECYTPVVMQQELVEPVQVPKTPPTEEVRDTPWEVMRAFKSCMTGTGLSLNDMTRLLKVFTHPSYKPTDVPFKTGRAGNLWLKKKMTDLGGLMVFFHYLYCCFMFIKALL